MTMQPDTYIADLADPVFRERMGALLKRDEADFAAWVSEGAVRDLIDEAITAAKIAFNASAHLSEEAHPDRWALVAIELAHPRAQPLVQGLCGKGIGTAEIQTFTYEVAFQDIFGRRKKASTKAQVVAALEAFAITLSKPGFELHLLREEVFESEAA